MYTNLSFLHFSHTFLCLLYLICVSGTAQRSTEVNSECQACTLEADANKNVFLVKVNIGWVVAANGQQTFGVHYVRIIALIKNLRIRTFFRS